MAFQGNPKKFAEDISKGFFMVSKPYLKNLAPAELKTIYNALKVVQRDVRAQVTIELDETKEKQIRLIRVSNALVQIENYARKYRIILG